MALLLLVLVASRHVFQTKTVKDKDAIQEMSLKTLATSFEDNVGWQFDCFLSHSWGPEQITHKKVIQIAELLKEEGFRCWLDEDNLTHDVTRDIAKRH